MDGDGLWQKAETEGEKIDQKDRPCIYNSDCDNTEECSADNICVPLGSCEVDNTAKKLYCIDGRYVYVECTEDAVASPAEDIISDVLSPTDDTDNSDFNSSFFRFAV